ncbi:MAG: GMC family oxidoreductase N-terminal domain-containing protein, partial [Hyphomicrobium sp.]
WSRTGRGGDWPFGYDELEPWYALAEQMLSVGGVASDEGPARSGEYPLPPFPWSAPERFLAESFRNAGLVPGHMPIARFNRCMTTGTCKYCPIGSRYTAQDHLAELVLKYPRALEIVTGCTARALLMEGRRARGLKYFDANAGEERTVSAERVVICAGAYESPKLLLQSPSPEWPHGVGNTTDQVGRYLVTHSMLTIKGRATSNKERWFQEYDFPTLMSRSWDTPERQRDGKIFLFNDRSRPNIDIARLMIKGRTRSEIEAALEGSRESGLHAFIEEAGGYANRLELGPGEGKFKLRQTRVQFDRDPHVGVYANKVLRDMAELLQAAGYTIIPDDKDGLQSPRGDHCSGTCRMGTSPSNSVVLVRRPVVSNTFNG